MTIKDIYNSSWEGFLSISHMNSYMCMGFNLSKKNLGFFEMFILIPSFLSPLGHSVPNITSHSVNYGFFLFILCQINLFPPFCQNKWNPNKSSITVPFLTFYQVNWNTSLLFNLNPSPDAHKTHIWCKYEYSIRRKQDED